MLGTRIERAINSLLRVLGVRHPKRASHRAVAAVLDSRLHPGDLDSEEAYASRWHASSSNFHVYKRLLRGVPIVTPAMSLPTTSSVAALLSFLATFALLGVGLALTPPGAQLGRAFRSNVSGDGASFLARLLARPNYSSL